MEKKSSYPVWRFHKGLLPDGKIVYSEQEDHALGLGWVDSPAKFDLPVEVKDEGPVAEPKPKKPRSKKVVEVGDDEKAPVERGEVKEVGGDSVKDEV